MRKTLFVLAALMAAGCDQTPKKIDLARKEIGVQSDALVAKNKMPKDQAEFDELTKVAGCPTDPWGVPYVFTKTGMRQFKISSKGPDGKNETADDISADFEFPSGYGLENLQVKRPDGTIAVKSPNEQKTFWTVQKQAGSDQITEYWIGDAAANAKAPAKTAKVGVDDYARAVSLTRWTEDGRYLVYRDVDSASRPDVKSKETLGAFDTTTGKELDPKTLSTSLAWVDY